MGVKISDKSIKIIDFVDDYMKDLDREETDAILYFTKKNTETLYLGFSPVTGYLAVIKPFEDFDNKYEDYLQLIKSRFEEIYELRVDEIYLHFS